jgi:hypothetical protein
MWVSFQEHGSCFEMSGGRLMQKLTGSGSVQEEEGGRGLRWSGEDADFELDEFR